MDAGEAANVARPAGVDTIAVGVLVETPAYRGGWRDGRFGQVGAFSGGRALTAWEGTDRLAYDRGYHEGLRVRRMLGRA